MHVHVCSCMVRYSHHVWSCMVLHGHVWSCMVIFGHVWSCFVMFGHVWSCMVMYGHVCSCMWNKWNILKMRNLKSVRIWNYGEKRNVVGIGNIGKIQLWKIEKSGKKEMSVE